MYLFYRILIIVLAALPFSTAAQLISTFAGGGIGSSDGVPATVAMINNPHGGVFDKYGNCYFVQSQGHRISKVGITGIISTVAGTGSMGYNGDGIPATSAKLNYPNAVAVDTAGNIYITDAANHRIRKVTISTGLISTIAGSGSSGFAGDGTPATAAIIYSPWGICFDKNNNLFFSDGLNYRIRKITPSGIISTITGNGINSYSGDGFAATSAQCSLVMGLRTDTFGNIFFADYGNSRVRKISSLGIITSIAGNGISLYSGDGTAATNTSVDPLDVEVDYNGKVFIIDHANNRIRMIDLLGIIHTVAGTGVAGFNGDGIVATSAKISNPGGLAIDECGNIYFGDVNNVRFRKITFKPHPCITLTVNEQSVKKEISIYPNPANDVLHLENVQPYTTYQLCSIVGTVMQGGSLNQSSSTISINHLPPGLYLLALTDEEGKSTVHKIVKE